LKTGCRLVPGCSSRARGWLRVRAGGQEAACKGLSEGERKGGKGGGGGGNAIPARS
jgi:hypothetical protein